MCTFLQWKRKWNASQVLASQTRSSRWLSFPPYIWIQLQTLRAGDLLTECSLSLKKRWSEPGDIQVDLKSNDTEPSGILAPLPQPSSMVIIVGLKEERPMLFYIMCKVKPDILAPGYTENQCLIIEIHFPNSAGFLFTSATTREHERKRSQNSPHIGRTEMCWPKWMQVSASVLQIRQGFLSHADAAVWL